MSAPEEVAINAAAMNSPHHEQSSSTDDKFLLYALWRVVAGIVIRLADKQDGIPRLVRAKERERFMQCIPQRDAFSQRGSAFNDFIHGGDAHLRFGGKAFGEGSLFGKDSEGHGLAFRRL